MNDWLSLCRNRPCSGCGAEDGTIVPAHANHLGKGMGFKCPDWTVSPLCMKCHAYLDGSDDRNSRHEFWEKVWLIHMAALCEAGLIAPLGHKERERRPVRLAKNLPRIKPRWDGPEAA